MVAGTAELVLVEDMMSLGIGGFAAQLSGLDNHSRKKVTIILNVRIKLPSRCCDITRLPRLVVERGQKESKRYSVTRGG